MGLSIGGGISFGGGITLAKGPDVASSVEYLVVAGGGSGAGSQVSFMWAAVFGILKG